MQYRKRSIFVIATSEILFPVILTKPNLSLFIVVTNTFTDYCELMRPKPTLVNQSIPLTNLFSHLSNLRCHDDINKWFKISINGVEGTVSCIQLHIRTNNNSVK